MLKVPPKIIELIKEFGKLTGYKTNNNIQKSSILLYADNEVSEGEIKETIPFTITNGILSLQKE